MNMINNIKCPTFFILGPARSGSASMYNILNQHPDVLMSSIKEPDFFQLNYGKGIEYYLNEYFSDWNGESAIGEAAHRNLYLPYVADRIKRECPNAKFIVILRDPIVRAYSHYWYSYSRDLETLSFEDAIKHDVERIKSGVNFGSEKDMRKYMSENNIDADINYFRTYLDSGCYYEQLKKYYGLFPHENFLVLRFEDFTKNTERVMSRVFKFLDVDDTFKIKPLKTKNKSRALWIQDIIEYLATKFKFRKYVPKRIKLLLIPSLEIIESVLDFIPGKNKQKYSSETKTLLRDYYLQSNKGLNSLTGIDIQTLIK